MLPDSQYKVIDDSCLRVGVLSAHVEPHSCHLLQHCHQP